MPKMRFQEKVVTEEIPLLPPTSLAQTFFPSFIHLIVFHPAAELMSVEYYYNQFKLGREVTLVKPLLAAVAICRHKLHEHCNADAKGGGG